MIYHVVPESEFRAGVDAGLYRPARFGEDGFVHCAPEAAVLPVARDFFTGVDERLLLLEIDPRTLGSELRDEPPVTPEGVGAAHRDAAAKFPHVYGPIEIEAIARIGVLEPSESGFSWPAGFEAPQRFLPRARDRSVFLRLAARDLGIAALALALWVFGSGLSAAENALGDLSGVVVGLVVGGLTFILHEWGHLLGALATRSVVQPARRVRSLYLFSFDSRRNSRTQFLVMSLAGFAGTGLAVWAWYGLLPPELLATRVARGVGLLSVTLTVVLELPLVAWALLGRRLPPVETFASHRSAGRA